MKTLKFLLIAAIFAALLMPVTSEAGLPPSMGPFTPTVAAGTTIDTVFVPDLAYIIRGYDISGWWVTVTYTTDGLAPLNESCQIISTSGSWCILDTTVQTVGQPCNYAQAATLGFSTILTTGDKVIITTDRPGGSIERSAFSLASSMLPSPAGKLFPITAYIAGTAKATDTLRVAGLASYTALFARPTLVNHPSQFYLRVVYADDNADTVLWGMWRPIVHAMHDSLIVSPGFDFTDGLTPSLDAGDMVEVVAFTDINPNSQVSYQGTSVSGSATTAVFPDLIGRDHAILVDSWIKCVIDEAGTDEGDMLPVLSFNDTTGTVTFLTGTLTPTVGDFWQITYSPTAELVGGALGVPTNPTGTFHAANVNELEMVAFLQDSLRKVAALLDATCFSPWDTLIIDFSVAGWNTEVAHKMFNVVGNVEFEICGYCSTDVTVTSADTISFMDADTTASVIALLGAEIDAGEALFPPWYFNGSQARGLVASYAITAAEAIYSTGSVWHGCAMKGIDLGYKLTDDAFTGGIIVVAWRWRAMTTGSTMTQGTGTQMTL